MAPCRIEILDLDREGIRELLAPLGKEAYRTSQIIRWLYGIKARRKAEVVFTRGWGG